VAGGLIGRATDALAASTGAIRARSCATSGTAGRRSTSHAAQLRDHTGRADPDPRGAPGEQPVPAHGRVDFVGRVRLLRERGGFSGWIPLHYDPPRPIENTIDQQLAHNRFYTSEFLGIAI
jgi:hypothetical protein